MHEREFASGNMNNLREDTTITSLIIGSTVSLALSLILPRIIGWSDDLAGATAAALTFAAFYILSLSLSFYLLGLTLLRLKRLIHWQRILGILPFPLVIAVGAVLLLFLGQWDQP
ncbi:MAG: hypothetical protein DBP03_17005 [gamma proteobacterium symbiont of Ctena orbiculata]|nr:hypothetical protein [Candidatus Thiodiazotropha sp. (ex Lucina pensylvanica)]MBV2093424.1 hypothetical protein [Candidatus Thiodiazotropha sp. (ex Codakia orbicularis)]PUB72478.1 MAG: hypothetical protein DBP03_17005 [gamma proteobacterium symbiont of Ctena orbiculata]PUB79903.1 MAG: hypothetical protein DBO99_02695 [gamma proteobacterium symbiont of Ctena orbiculata]